MNVHLRIEPHDTLHVQLRDGTEETTLTVSPSAAGAASLSRALDDALAHGYGECFWPAPTGGQYWWMLKREGDALEIIAMWTRGGASLWEHVFRATDNASFVRERLTEEINGLTLA